MVRMASVENPIQSGLPEHSRRVFNGELFEVWQWEQKLFDGSSAIFERLRRQDTATVIAVADDKILFQEQLQPESAEPFFSLPGGRIEWEEDPLEGGKRELLEETGYVSDDWQLWRAVQSSHKIVWTMHFYIARACVKREEPHMDAGEKITTTRISFEELIALSDNPRFHDRELITEFLRMRLEEPRKEAFRNLLFLRR